MQVALTSIVGTRDFASFATRPRHRQRSTVRTMISATATQDGEQFEIELHADSFLQHMVRNIVRAVVRIGDAGALSAGERVLLVLGLSDGTYHQLQAVVVKTRAGRFVRSDTLAASIRVHLERLLKSAGVSR